MLGILASFWEGLFSGAMLVLGSVEVYALGGSTQYSFQDIPMTPRSIFLPTDTGGKQFLDWGKSDKCTSGNLRDVGSQERSVDDDSHWQMFWLWHCIILLLDHVFSSYYKLIPNKIHPF